MGESICLVRSFSQPAEFSAHETNEVVPRRVLTESVSFGRFANETLSWEKWSAFTQNRYLEEVERFTKPGSVAQKKAFFEAHFKSRAAGRVVTQTKKIEEVKVNRTSDDEIVCDEVPKDILVDSEVVVGNGMSMDEVRHGEVSTAEVDSVVPSVPLIIDVKTGEVENLKSVIVPEDNALDEENSTSLSKERRPSSSGSKACTRKLSSSSSKRSISVSKNLSRSPPEPVHMSISCAPAGNTAKTIVQIHQNGSRSSTIVNDKENSTLLSKERRPSSSGSKVCITSSKLEPSVVIGLNHSLKNTRKESSSSSTRSTSVSKKQSRSPPEPFHMSISCAPSGNTDKKIVEMPQNGCRSSTIAKGAGKADKKKRSVPISVHMSLNFAPSARQATKTIPKKLARKSTTQETTSSNARNSGNEPTGVPKSRKRPLPRTSKEGSKTAKCSTSASAARLPELPPPKNELSENKRKKLSAESSFSCKVPNNVQRQPSVGENLSTHSRTKSRSVTVSSPFVFRSDERAERRKEFFKKLQEQNKKEDAVKEQLSCVFKANQNTHVASEEHKKNPQVGCFQVPLISMTSPRFCRNQTSGTVQTPHKASSTKIIYTKKTVMEKLKGCKIHPSSKSLAKIKTQENLSPNVLWQ
ncbi:protein WVD2-like 7 isoform X2 [Capsella rubella]|uniref:protein WVD2-like 7 isoform X2 n=1 Tax=Capsella rubella TaxID=81985 RepID=UPI000CD509D2|nr:protein WVD2-like 7 isoform X2 [Capsella rubella]